ncbi:hypothetical protein HGRIS_013927 [Hohenbuehelia grisea]|uniref:Uncharacterized protein n=1 Tax=Hohenbuehelia grisea TaxID=104357 RepID=A0ABR3JTX2_9AGAR
MNSVFKLLLLLSASAAFTGGAARLPTYGEPGQASADKDDLYSKIIRSGNKLNDWSKPCVGQCAFDIPDTEEGTGSMQLSGDAIVDITPAGNWWFTKKCTRDDHKLSELKEIEIAFKCMKPGQCPDALTFKGKVARLPEKDCPTFGFAVIKDIRNNGNGFTARIGNNLKDAATDGEFVLNGLSAGGKAQQSAFSTGKLIRRGTYPPSRHPRRWEVDPSTTFKFQKTLERTTLIDAAVDCGKVQVESSLAISGNADVTAKVGIYIRGTWYGAIKEAYAFTILNGEVSGTVDLSFSAEGKFDTDEISLLVQGIPGLTFGKFFKVGPTLELLARADGAFKVTADMNYNFKYTMDQTEMRFPDNRDSKFEPNPAQSPLSMDIEQSAEAHGYIRGHVIPRLTVSLTSWGIIDAAFFVDVDASLTAEVNAWGSRVKSITPVPKDATDGTNGGNDGQTGANLPADGNPSPNQYDNYSADNGSQLPADSASNDSASDQSDNFPGGKEIRRRSPQTARVPAPRFPRTSQPTQPTRPTAKTPQTWNRITNTTGTGETVDITQSTQETPELNSTDWNSAYGGFVNITATLDVRAGAFLKSGIAAQKVLDLFGVGDSLGKTFILLTKTFVLYETKWGKDAEAPATDDASTTGSGEAQMTRRALPAGARRIHAPVIPIGEKHDMKAPGEAGKGKGLLPIQIPGLGCSIDFSSEAKTQVKQGYANGKATVKDLMHDAKSIKDTTKPRLQTA